MDVEYERVDLREPLSEEQRKNNLRITELQFKLNHTFWLTEEYEKIEKELFNGNFGELSRITPPLNGVCFDLVQIGKNVVIGANCLMMARGGMIIEDDVRIAANVQLITNNHDLYERDVLTCKPILIKKDAWIGAGATILPGVEVGKHSIIGACSVVTKDVPDYGVVVGNPAKLIKTLDKEKFKD